MLRKAPITVRPACFFAVLVLFAGIGEAGTPVADARQAGDVSRLRLQVTVADATVTVKAYDVTLKHLLEEIARRGGIEVELHDALDERVTLELDRRPLPEVLRRVLSGRNFAFRLVDPAVCGSCPSQLWVFEAPAPPTLEAVEPCPRPAPAEEDANARLKAISKLAGAPADGSRALETLAAAALSDAAASVREEALHGLGELGDATALIVLEQALADPAPRVREAAVEALAELGEDAAAWVLAPVLAAEDAALRERAVFALGELGGEAAVVVLQQALVDERGFVREAAVEALQDLSAVKRSPED